MSFSDKLNYLFELTGAEGKELASAMNVTPPQISKMRKGVRGLPKDKDSARTLSRFFAQRCGSDYQRDALSKALKIAQLRTVDKESVMTDILLDWLSDERNPDDYAARRADLFLQQFGAAEGDDTLELPERNEQPYSSTESVSRFFAYYGSAGRREAVTTFLDFLIKLNRPFTIDILTDENLYWVTEEASYSRSLQARMVRLTEQGCNFRRISGPILDMDQAFESLNRWFPLYMTGKATSYYYKRMRDNLNHITIFAVPDVAVMFSLSVGGVPQNNAVTFFTMNKETVASMVTEFNNYLSLCEPIMRTHSISSSSKQLIDCMLDYESCKSSCIQRSNSLSFITLPWEVAMTLDSGGNQERKNQILTVFAQRHKKFQENLQQHSFVDIIRLADIPDIMEGKVLMPGACVMGGGAQTYTPQGYLRHLRSILYLLEHREHYHVVFRTPEDSDPTIIYVKEGYRAILFREIIPFTAFEVSERYLVDAFTEYLRRFVSTEQGEITAKRTSIAIIRKLIEQLEPLLNVDS